jgi:eukaryotic-like serine/threonine-protein kinase
VLYELLSGTRAFNGRGVTEVTYQLLTTEPPNLTDIAADVPEALAAVLRHAMAKSRETRYASAQTMADALVLALRDDAQAVATAAGDRTVVMPRAAFDSAVQAPVDDATLDTIERRLARHVGPIARHLVRDAARRTNSVEALCQTVSRNIAQAAAREQFMAESLGGTIIRTERTTVQRSAVTSRVPITNISAEQIERAERALTKAVGPIAKVLVKRALPSAASEAALWEQLATHIQRAADREAFLRLRPGA